LNAVKHGMAGELAEVEAMASAAFDERRAKWGEEFQPVGEAGEWALDRAVAASLRIERCERAIDEILVAGSERARLAWDQDRAVEAAIVFGRLARDPVLASRQLQTTFAGVELLIEAWLGLASTLQVGDWSEAEVSRALDLLGMSPDGRSCLTPVDDPEGGNAVAFRRLLTFKEIERLESLRDEVMAPLEDLEQRQAIAGNVALLSKPAKLVLRYERDAWHRYRESMKQIQGPAKAEVPAIEVPAVEVPVPRVEVPPARKPEARKAAEVDSGRSFEEEREELLALVAPLREMLGGRFEELALGAGPDWLDELEARLDAADARATERTQSVGGPSDRFRG
jgi:hypothetical protein